MAVTNEQPDARAQIVGLVTRAEAIIESLEVKESSARWALTAFSRFRVCELLGVTPYSPHDGDRDGDPADLLDQAAVAADGLEVAASDLGWCLALADALRSAAADVRMVRNARDV